MEPLSAWSNSRIRLGGGAVNTLNCLLVEVVKLFHFYYISS